ncbi:uncharacterized protein [Garra rufa]|uniref:uncharacterized protein n=1 Tax=Garra rufa TaxID=137080 RepID=UPI003CCE8DF0
MEGDSVTLESGFTELLEDYLLIWTFGRPETRIAQSNKPTGIFSTYDGPDKRFRDRLKLDHQTGSLTITNTRTTDSGLYQIFTGSRKETTYRFNFTVYAHLPVPVISRDCSSSSSSSSSYCSLLCSVVNVSHVTLSWFQGNSLLSSIGASDLSISLSLPLEVEYQDNNTYSCVLNNPISNQTQHLDIGKLCHTCSGSVHCSITEAVIRLVLSALVGVATVIILVYDIRSNRAEQDQTYVCKSGVFADSYSVKSVSVTEGDSVTLQSGLTELQSDEPITWIFEIGDSYELAIRIAQIFKEGEIFITFDGPDGRFRDRLKVDHQTGSLTITNARTTHSGLYQMFIRREITCKFNVTVSAHLPFPVFSRILSSCSSNCSLLCSVVNVSRVTLSWYKGNSLLSSISASDLSISLSLPLEVEYQDKNSYSCVLNNPISNQTQHLDISKLCHTCSDSVHCCGPTGAVIRLVLSALVGVATVFILVYDVRSRKTEQDEQNASVCLLIRVQ